MIPPRHLNSQTYRPYKRVDSKQHLKYGRPREKDQPASNKKGVVGRTDNMTPKLPRTTLSKPNIRKPFSLIVLIFIPHLLSKHSHDRSTSNYQITFISSMKYPNTKKRVQHLCYTL